MVLRYSYDFAVGNNCRMTGSRIVHKLKAMCRNSHQDDCHPNVPLRGHTTFHSLHLKALLLRHFLHLALTSCLRQQQAFLHQ